MWGTKPRKEHKLPDYDYPRKKVKGVDRQPHSTTENNCVDVNNFPEPLESQPRKPKPLKLLENDPIYRIISLEDKHNISEIWNTERIEYKYSFIATSLANNITLD